MLSLIFMVKCTKLKLRQLLLVRSFIPVIPPFGKWGLEDSTEVSMGYTARPCCRSRPDVHSELQVSQGCIVKPENTDRILIQDLPYQFLSTSICSWIRCLKK